MNTYYCFAFLFILIFSAFQPLQWSSSSTFVYCKTLSLSTSKANKIEKYSASKNNEFSFKNLTENVDWPPLRVCSYEKTCCLEKNGCFQLDPRKTTVETAKSQALLSKSTQKVSVFLIRKKRAHFRSKGKSGGLSSRLSSTKISHQRPQTLNHKPRTSTSQHHTLKESPGYKSQRKASIGYQLVHKNLKHNKPVSKSIGKENKPLSGSLSAAPKRHHISANSGPNDSNKTPGKSMKPKSIQPKKSLKTVVKDAGSERFPVRKVQTNPKAGGRIEYQKSEISVNNLGKGTRTNVVSRKRSKSLGNQGDHTGHILGASLGGRGDKSNTFPQNAQVNTGNWKKMEGVIRKDVQQHGKVTLSQQLLYGDKKATRPNSMRFKVESQNGDLIRYGKVDNPFVKQAEGA